MRYVLAVLLCLLPGCARGGGDDGRVTVVTAVYPLTYAVQRIGGEHVRVVDLAPPGAEPHDVELTPAQVGRVEQADLVVLVRGLQPALDDAAGVRTLDVLRGGTDPHVWLDPPAYAEIVALITARLVALDREHAPAFSDNARTFAAELESFHGDAQETLARCARKDLVTSHAAFGRFAKRYGLRETGIAGVGDEAEPSPARLAEVAALVERNGVTTVFAESADSRPAQTVAREAGAQVAVLDPLEVSRGDDYLTVMRRNLDAVKTGLGCG
ncbi:MAG TPA: metal ABC transporter substrate-binding protein [Frankiaceae bacterium]|nr:metal ABC transporter substrate-binding protein [Frankiaceae bacterium]